MAKHRGLYKIGDTWYLSYARNGKTVRRSTKQKNFRVAQEMLQAVKADISRGVYSLDKKEAPLFADYADNFLETYSKLNKRSWARDALSIKHLKAAFKGLRLTEVTREHVEAYKGDRLRESTNRGRPPTPATINRELACLKTIFNRAVDAGKTDRNPVSFRGALFRENNKVERILSKTEEARLYEVCLNHLPRRIYWIIYTAFQTGMRRGELLNLKWEDIDFENRLITVKAAIAKNGKARTIPINRNLILLLKEIKKETFKTGQYVFTGERPVKNIQTSFNKAKQLANIDLRFRFHDIRHTVASRLVTENSIDVITVAKILGHSSLKMLERYAHTRKEIELSAMQTLSDNGIHPQLHSNCTVDNGAESEDTLTTEVPLKQVLTSYRPVGQLVSAMDK